MTVTRNQFIAFMQKWMRGADPSVRNALPARQFTSVYKLCQSSGSGISLDPRRLVDEVLGGDESLLDSLAVPLSQAIAKEWGGAAPEARSTGARPIGTLRDPGHRIGAGSPQADRSGRPGSLEARLAARSLADTSSQARTPAPSAAQAAAPAAVEVAAPAWGTPDQVPAPPAEPAATVAASPEPEPEPDWAFPAYNFEREDLDTYDNPVRVSVQRLEDGRVMYSWPDAGEGEVYRVMTSDEAVVEDPASGIEVAVTEGQTCEDPFDHPYGVHFVSVWAYTKVPGTTVLGQCRRVASVVDVHPLVGWDVEFDEDSRAVIGRWEQVFLPANARHRVITARLPQGQSIGSLMRGGMWQRYAIDNNGAGFQDLDVSGGRRYTYLASVEVEIDGQTYSSSPQRSDLHVPRLVEPVTDLEVRAIDSPGGTTAQTLTITWTENIGSDVRVYLTPQPPNQGAISRGRIPMSQLAAAGLPEEAQIRNPAGVEPLEDDADRQRRTLSAVPWRDEGQWDSLCVTAVVVAGDEVALSAPTRLKRVMPPHHPSVDRHPGSHDRITFQWPGEALKVVLSTDAEGKQAVASIDRDTYHKEGAFLIPYGYIAAGGAPIYLSSEQFLEGRAQQSRTVSLQVPPLWLYRYSIDWPSAARRHLGGGKYACITIESLSPQAAVQPQIRLMRHRTHVPLSQYDGEAVPVMWTEPVKGMAPEEMQTAAVVAIPPTGGMLWVDVSMCEGHFVRLVVAESSQHADTGTGNGVHLEHIAMLDPSLADLNRMSTGRRLFK